MILPLWETVYFLLLYVINHEISYLKANGRQDKSCSLVPCARAAVSLQALTGGVEALVHPVLGWHSSALFKVLPSDWNTVCLRL